MKDKIVKEVCIKCRANKDDVFIRWENLDERLWNELGYVKCYDSEIKYRNVKSGVPDSCVMKLEHAILRQKIDKGTDKWK